MPGRHLGSLIGACFGLVYVLVNAGPLPAGAAWTLRLLGLAAFAVVAVTTVRGGRGAVSEPTGRRPGAGYWLVVALEVVGIVVGVRVVTGPLGMPDAGVAWVSVVVGLHFFGLGALFRVGLFHWLAVGITLCGAVGLALGATDRSAAAIAVAGGVVPGFLLLAVAWWGARPRVGDDRSVRLEPGG